MSATKTCNFFANGTTNQFEWMLKHYDKCLELKAQTKSSKPENVIKLDKWYQNELPKKIKSRGKDAHLVHEEIVQTIKWKLARGKFRPNLTNLVRMNTPRVVMQETKKAFKKINKNQDIHAAMSALCNLKGVGPAMASAVLSAGAPELAPYMADECLLSMPDVEGLDYTMREYMRYVDYVKTVVDRLNSQGGSWDPHKVELAVWTHYVASDLQPELLEGMPAPITGPDSAPIAAAAATTTPAPAAKTPDEKVVNGDNGDKKEEETEEEKKEEESTNEKDEDKKAQEENGSAATDAAAAEPAPKNGTQNGVQKDQEEKTNGNGTSVNGTAEKSSSSEIPSSTDSESTNDSTVSAENDSASKKEAVTTTTTTTTNAVVETTSSSSSSSQPQQQMPQQQKRPAEEEQEKEEVVDQPASKKMKADQQLNEQQQEASA